MLRINLGYWQNAVAGEVMTRAWEIVRATKCKLAEGLRKAWKEIKNFVNNISTTYKEYRAKLNIIVNNKKQSFDITGIDMEEVMENSLEKIEEIRGRSYYNNMCKWFMSKYDLAIEMLSSRRKYTFADGLWLVITN